MVAGQKEGEAEYRVLYPDGSIRWLHDRWIVLRNRQGKPVAVQGFIRDNTRRRLSELQFIESKQNALIGSYIVQQGKFKYVNPKFTSITGYIEKEQAGKIFQLFSSSKGNRGTGIGLFVTRKAILKHGGAITVESSPNEGAKFRITLPRKPPARR